jgi:4-hydroxybenzoyl-CoA thioesterase
MFSHSHRLTVEFGDCDPAGIVFYPRFFAMFDAATAFLLEAATGMPRSELIQKYAIIGWPMVDTRAVFREPVTFDDKVRIDSLVVRLGRSSLTIEHKLVRNSMLCVECSEIRVWTARLPNEPRLGSVPIPEELRRRLMVS